MQARRPPEPGSKSARELLDLVQNGLQTWGLAGSVNALSGNPNAPLRNMPGGMSELNRPRPPKQVGVPGTPGNPLGPRKKQGRIYSRRKSCIKKRDIRCPAGTTMTKKTTKYPKLHLNGRGGVMVAFTTLSPYAHDILAAVKNWDNPVGEAVAWFDGAMAGLQESIGGKNVPEINGNELKLWLVCLFRSDNPRYPDAVDEACQRRKNAPPEEQQQQQQAIDGLNQVGELCETAEDHPSDENRKTELLKSCNKFAEILENMVDANAGLVLMGEVARARTLNNHDIEDSDQAVVEGFIEKGAFGPNTNQTETSELASLYLSHMSAYIIAEQEEDGSEILIHHDMPPVWLELLQMGAGYIPEDRAAVNEALQLLDGSPHLRSFDKEGRQSLVAVQTCWDQAGLLAFQPPQWDIISASIVYLERKLQDTNSALACAPCIAPAGFWVLRCGSAVP
ncbi:uncharacterized protein BBA_09820 [Beauveria bassiana ARSEF 2860]|uniref:Uncharacterized protein n=1 Tax=Beauveria bassiana (strain ARSEF 2860) TaxID=655819 RepID=J5J3C6_BEAB2|nr:uncharacterized protein BBA_09820 [Beauveria bassiana ARSEF 2860]EJP61243.1 hypothetical protein BBA_09820 [Beauveria bassiana ARSEF 2860]